MLLTRIGIFRTSKVYRDNLQLKGNSSPSQPGRKRGGMEVRRRAWQVCSIILKLAEAGPRAEQGPEAERTQTIYHASKTNLNHKLPW